MSGGRPTSEDLPSSPLCLPPSQSVVTIIDRLDRIKADIFEKTEEINDCIEQYESVQRMPETATITQFPEWRHKLLTALRVQMSSSEDDYQDRVCDFRRVLDELETQRNGHLKAPSMTFLRDLDLVVKTNSEFYRTCSTSVSSIELKRKPEISMPSVEFQKAVERITNDLKITV